MPLNDLKDILRRRAELLKILQQIWQMWDEQRGIGRQRRCEFFLHIGHQLILPEDV
ncbi:hypothetical protein SDC9_59260 [bioreactor metagenome]|uniref:Uncharacterized protein n=1 Tax=bioreactor metagenome TaxID=1076179 RepID=A0A644X9P2_9ZZZZ